MPAKIKRTPGSPLLLADLVGDFLARRDPHFYLAPYQTKNATTYRQGDGFATHVLCRCVGHGSSGERPAGYNMGWIHDDCAIIWTSRRTDDEGKKISASDPEFFEKMYQALVEWHKIAGYRWKGAV